MAKINAPRVGVALSGGYALGIAHIGALKSLLDHHIPITSIAGTSSGAVIAACYAFNVPLDVLTEKAKDLSWYRLSKFSFSGLGLVSNSELGRLIHQLLGKVNIEDAKIPLAIVATDLETGERVVFKEGSLTDALMASTCIPGIFVPVEIGGRLLVDGGLVDNLPFSALPESEATVKIGVNINRWVSQKRPKNIFDVVAKSLEIVTVYRRLLEKNELLIEPHLEVFSPSDFRRADRLVAEGYRAATLKIPEIRKLLGEKVPAEAGLWARIRSWWG